MCFATKSELLSTMGNILVPMVPHPKRINKRDYETATAPEEAKDRSLKQQILWSVAKFVAIIVVVLVLFAIVRQLALKESTIPTHLDSVLHLPFNSSETF